MGADCIDFVHDIAFEDLTPEAVAQAKMLLLDLIGVAWGGSQTALSRIVRDHAVAHFGGGRARMLCDGRAVSAPGAALVGGMSIDALDAHDGQKLTKGHAGCGVFPTLLAVSEQEGADDPRAFLAGLVAGYEIATRAGIALHRTAADYHTSGAWVALASAALGARVLGLDRVRTREAIGIAEYHGPRSQMMRCIDHPTMVKDGSGWGAMAGLSAAYLARDGFTGAPAVSVEADAVADIWGDLGTRWYLFEQYIKVFPICRWAQPPVQAVLDLRAAHGVVAQDVARIEVETFHEAVRLAVRDPKTTEQAQYSTAYPVAVAMVSGQIGAHEVSQAAFGDPEVQRLAAGMVFGEAAAFNAAFPAQRFARVTLVLRDGRRLVSGVTEARGDPEAPLSAAEVRAKYDGLARPVIGVARADEIADLVGGLERAADLSALRAALHVA